MADRDGGDGFLARWSRRKAQARRGLAVPESPLPARAPSDPLEAVLLDQAPDASRADAPTAEDSLPVERSEVAATGEAAPTLADVAQLTPESDFTRFVAHGVQTDVKNAALKKLFTDPHFNVMDGLDVYIDDYGVSDPLPLAVLRKLAQARFLGLPPEAAPEQIAPVLDPLKQDAPDIAPAPPDAGATREERIAAHEDTDLQLQPDDAAGRTCAAPGAGVDPGREQ